MAVAFLDLEDVNEFFRMFDEKDKDDTTIAIGQVNNRITDSELITVELIVSTRVDYPENGDTIVRYAEPVGIYLIPLESLKEGGRRQEEEYNKRKKNMDIVVKKANELKNNHILKFEGKGFSVVKGVWSI